MTMLEFPNERSCSILFLSPYPIPLLTRVSVQQMIGALQLVQYDIEAINIAILYITNIPQYY